MYFCPHYSYHLHESADRGGPEILQVLHGWFLPVGSLCPHGLCSLTVHINSCSLPLGMMFPRPGNTLPDDWDSGSQPVGNRKPSGAVSEVHMVAKL